MYFHMMVKELRELERNVGKRKREVFTMSMKNDVVGGDDARKKSLI